MKNQAYRMSMLFDFFGDVLTDRQKEFYDLYYNEDLSLGEIAENYHITRQGVRDVIARAAKILEDLEEKTGIIRHYQIMHKQLLDLERDAGALVELSNRYDDAELDALAVRIQDGVETLLKE